MHFVRTKLPFLILGLFFVFYLFWLNRAYYDVAWMDQIQLLAGNVRHYYNRDMTIQDYYFRPPFLLIPSTLLLFLNCEIFGYNTYLETFATALILLFLGYVFLRRHLRFFSGTNRYVFAFFTGLIVFGLHKWEMSLWGAGYSHYLVVFLAFLLMNLTHMYYLEELKRPFLRRYFFPLYILLTVFAILETTGFFIAYQISVLLLLLANFRLFRGRIDVPKWRRMVFANIILLFAGLAVNYMAELYAAKHPYDSYAKINLSESMGNSLMKIVEEPAFVTKFFLLSNASSLSDYDTYRDWEGFKNAMPLIGLALMLGYAFALFRYFKIRRPAFIVPINMILYAVLFYAFVMVGRLQFNDLYFGAASRYVAATFTGILGLATILLLLYEESKRSRIRRTLYLVPLGFILACYLFTDFRQWQIAPYRQESFRQMADNLKRNQDLMSLQGNNLEITQKARKTMLKNNLNVFRPGDRLDQFRLNAAQEDLKAFGFYDLEKTEHGGFRWTNGTGELHLPNLFTNEDSVNVVLDYYTPRPDTPKIVLNDNLVPSSVRMEEGKIRYTVPMHGQRVVFKASIQNNSFVPRERDSTVADERRLGLIFNSIFFSDKPEK